MGIERPRPVLQQGPGHFLLGLWLDDLYRHLAGSGGCLDIAAPEVPDQFVPYAVVSGFCFFYGKKKIFMTTDRQN
jgi:hypothetical protein